MPPIKSAYPLYLANEPVFANQDLAVTDKFNGAVATRVAMADPAMIDQAIAAAVTATEPMARLAAFERQAVLAHCVQRFTERADEL
ncbi:MAG TPA: aldehyde dehydrogenase family protein, partial [Caulobacter sp.]|nr:aldehyde dehydrogenase family protein [Caulobacter sp.]